MSVNEVKKDALWHFNYEGFQKNVEAHCLTSIDQFKKIVRSYMFFHLFFLGFLTAEVSTFFVSLTILFQRSLIAISLAAILVTGFTYLILLFYFQTKKPGQFFELRNYFMLLCKKRLPKSLLRSEYHLSLANAAYQFATQLNRHESHLHKAISKTVSLNHLIRKFTNFCYHKDIQQMQELLLIVSVNEHVQLIKNTPTNLEAHASLANTYVALSRLYRHQEGDKFKRTTEKAIEEFKIIDHYSPKDPWVHAQLASCYHDLKMIGEEIHEYEKILSLCPEDKQILFRLGILYFQKGESAKGLQIYETLQAMHFSRAEELIDFYDANIKQEYLVTSL